MSSTRREYVEPGYDITVQHCEEPGCDKYLGVNYPSSYCDEHKRVFHRFYSATGTLVAVVFEADQVAYYRARGFQEVVDS